jgi:hypothetical protein
MASSRSEHSSMVASSSCFLLDGVVDVLLPQAADCQLDARQEGAQVVGHSPEDGGAHAVAFGQAKHLASAVRELAAFELSREVDSERAEQAPVAGWQDPA